MPASVPAPVPDLVAGPDGRLRCRWGAEPDIYREYHDLEWGRPVLAEDQLFEKLVLEGFQAGISWITILRKRENFRRAFANFDIASVAQFDAQDIDRLVSDTGIVRNRAKIEAAVTNAQAVLELQGSGSSLRGLIWSHRPQSVAQRQRLSQVPNTTEESDRLSRALKERGFRFVGPTTMYALMQAMGLVNDHVIGCWVHAEVQQLQDEIRNIVDLVSESGSPEAGGDHS